MNQTENRFYREPPPPETADARPVGEVPAQISELNDRLAELQAVTSKLRERLAPLTYPTPKAVNSQSAKDMPCGTELGRVLFVAKDRVAQVNADLHDLLSSIAL